MADTSRVLYNFESTGSLATKIAIERSSLLQRFLYRKGYDPEFPDPNRPFTRRDDLSIEGSFSVNKALSPEDTEFIERDFSMSLSNA